ncbi:MAG: hypothetical protein CML81_03285 [Rhodobiaceae bacterium]|nr:hypothetical protein [Rhodobiaceae bacterium]RPF97408.1 MAG: SDR family NAD(P)-dependent oxidoreductase [Rhizobiales bacterium TMED227]|tara:strand:+ start:1589 stop:2353 length:765 start_codon:yes stop_codon:yes gene_type:complete
MSHKWKSAWVTGASSGIGRNLSIALAKKGVKVFASARREDRLSEISKMSENIIPLVMDVTDEKKLIKDTKIFTESTHNLPDLIILNAGISRLFTVDNLDQNYNLVKESIDINYFGVMNCLKIIIPHFIKRKSGHIAIMASVAGYRGLPNSIAYSPTKAALINLAEVLKSELRQYGITVSLINPGFVDTDASKVNKFPMPSMVSIEYATKKIISGLEKSKYEIIFPFFFGLVLKMLRIMPNSLYFYFINKMIWKK